MTAPVDDKLVYSKWISLSSRACKLATSSSRCLPMCDFLAPAVVNTLWHPLDVGVIFSQTQLCQQIHSEFASNWPYFYNLIFEDLLDVANYLLRPFLPSLMDTLEQYANDAPENYAAILFVHLLLWAMYGSDYAKTANTKRYATDPTSQQCSTVDINWWQQYWCRPECVVERAKLFHLIGTVTKRRLARNIVPHNRTILRSWLSHQEALAIIGIYPSQHQQPSPLVHDSPITVLPTTTAIAGSPTHHTDHTSSDVHAWSTIMTSSYIQQNLLTLSLRIPLHYLHRYFAAGAAQTPVIPIICS